MKSNPQIITKFYDYLMYVVPQISKFPKNQRYVLGDRLENLSFDVLELLIEAVYSREKLAILKKCNFKLEKRIMEIAI